MKLGIVSSLLAVVALLTPSQAMTQLEPGDIAFLCYVSRPNPDDFAFVLLKDVVIGTEIKFTTAGVDMNGNIDPDEDDFTWTAPSALSAGTIVIYLQDSADFTTTSMAGFLNQGGDNVLAFQGDKLSSPNIIALIHAGSSDFMLNTDNSETQLPNVLTQGLTAIAIGDGPGSKEQTGIYSNTDFVGTREELLPIINDVNNWTTEDNDFATLFNVQPT